MKLTGCGASKKMSLRICIHDRVLLHNVLFLYNLVLPLPHVLCTYFSSLRVCEFAFEMDLGSNYSFLRELTGMI